MGRRRRGRREESQEMYGFLYTSMDAMVCLELVWKNQTINPFFDEFGYKRTLLCILVVFGSLD